MLEVEQKIKRKNRNKRESRKQRTEGCKKGFKISKGDFVLLILFLTMWLNCLTINSQAPISLYQYPVVLSTVVLHSQPFPLHQKPIGNRQKQSSTKTQSIHSGQRLDIHYPSQTQATELHGKQNIRHGHTGSRPIYEKKVWFWNTPENQDGGCK